MFRFIVKWAFRTAAILVILTLLAVLALMHRAIYDRVWNFPREAAAWEALRAERQDPPFTDGWPRFRGVLHSHSHISHDSMVPFEEILEVLQKTDRDFIGMSDHCVDGKADYSLQWRGIYDGKLFFPGYEMRYGFMPWGLPSETILDCSEEPEVLAAEIAAKGGMLFFAHTEQDRLWDLPELVGKEIYNIHTDIIDEHIPTLVFSKLPSMLLNSRRYPAQSMRLIFDHPEDQIARWDEMNRERRITGIPANDCHQNVGIRMTVSEDGSKLIVEDTSPKLVAEYSLRGWRWLLARILLGRLEPGTEVFHFQGDPYDVMVDMVATHVLASELSEKAVLDALENARVYVGFDAIADARGFSFMARSGDTLVVMGDYLPFGPDVLLRAASPLPVQFRVFRHGEPVHQVEGRSFEWRPDAPGAYRVEAWVDIRGRWTPWIYTNPIYLTESPGPTATESGHLLAHTAR